MALITSCVLLKCQGCRFAEKTSQEKDPDRNQHGLDNFIFLPLLTFCSYTFTGPPLKPVTSLVDLGDYEMVLFGLLYSREYSHKIQPAHMLLELGCSNFNCPHLTQYSLYLAQTGLYTVTQRPP